MAGDLFYTTLVHKKRKELGISMIEYCVADLIDRMSNKPEHPYCRRTQKYMCEFFGVSKRTMIRSIDNLVSLGLIEQRGHGYRSTEKYFKTVVIDESEKSANVAHLQNGEVPERHQESANVAPKKCQNGTAIDIKHKKDIKSVSDETDGKAVFGNAEINSVLEEFKAITGLDSTNPKDRFCAKHLLRKFSRTQITLMIRFCVENEYAPVLASVTELWSKREKIHAVVNRINLKKQNEIQHAQKTVDLTIQKQALMKSMTP